MEQFFASLVSPRDLLREKTLPFPYEEFRYILDLRALMGDEELKGVVGELDRVFGGALE